MQRTDADFQTDKVLLISGSHFVHDIYSSFLSPFLPLLISKFGLSMFLAGTLTIMLRLPSLFNLVIGIISDRFELGVLALVAPAITSITMSLMGLTPNYTILCIFLLTAGLSAAFFHVLGPPMIARLSGVNLDRGMGFWMGGDGSHYRAPIRRVDCYQSEPGGVLSRYDCRDYGVTISPDTPQGD
jgi:FSR family fosmidomycin resistance protein-like MFS transporter